MDIKKKNISREVARQCDILFSRNENGIGFIDLSISIKRL